ncbi:hypothetical protein [Rhodococcus qingshengii]|uniref:hypothetical protein n=1 Tax=Rhodococcus qingshengii TaxID=334542 RepID=UPI00287FDCCD|nr:hypothetical protein [Rhodococcus qingshengii]
MKSFLSTRIRNIALLKIAIPIAITVLSIGAVFMIVAAVTSAILAPIESVQNAVSSFFTGDDDSVSGESGASNTDLRTCVPIDSVRLGEVVRTVPPRTELNVAWAWIAWRTQEVLRGNEPVYPSIIDFTASTAGQQAAAAVGADSESIVDMFADSTPYDYTIAAIVGVVDLVQRGIVTAPDEDTVTELSAVLADQCTS